jgi:hypothetical protein
MFLSVNEVMAGRFLVEVQYVVPITAYAALGMFDVLRATLGPTKLEANRLGIKSETCLFAPLAVLSLYDVNIFVQGLEIIQALRVHLINAWVVISTVFMITLDATPATVSINPCNYTRLGGNAIPNVLTYAFSNSTVFVEPLELIRLYCPGRGESYQLEPLSQRTVIAPPVPSICMV